MLRYKTGSNGLSHLFSSVSDLSFLGLALLRIWLSVMLGVFASLNHDVVLAEVSFYGVRAVTALVAAGVFFAFGYSRLGIWDRFSFPLAIGMGLCSLVFVVSPEGSGTPMVLLVTLIVVAGIGCEWLHMGYLCAYSVMNPIRAVSYVLIALALRAFACLAFDEFLSGVLLPLVAAFPLFSLFLCRKSCLKLEIKQKLVEKGEKTLSEGNPNWRLFAVFAVYGLTVGFLHYSENGVFAAKELLALWPLLSLLLCLALLFWVVSQGRFAEIDRLCQIALMILVGAVLILLICEEGFASELPLSQMVCSTVGIFALLVVVTVSCESSLHPCVIYGCGWGCYMVFRTMGMVVSSVWSMDEFPVWLAIALIYALLLSVFFLKSSVRKGQADNNVENDSFIASRCELATKKYGLTARECEVLKLLCEGRSKAVIAEKLFVSENTVREHVKHIYSKTGVHSKQDLINLLRS